MHEMQVHPVGLVFIVYLFGVIFFFVGLFVGTNCAYSRCEKILGIR